MLRGRSEVAIQRNTMLTESLVIVFLVSTSSVQSDSGSSKQPTVQRSLVRYRGPVIISGLPPPVVHFPPVPPPPKGLPTIDPHRPIQYVPYPYHDLPVIIYRSKDHPPIHVVSKANVKENDIQRPPDKEFTRGGSHRGGSSPTQQNSFRPHTRERYPAKSQSQPFRGPARNPQGVRYGAGYREDDKEVGNYAEASEKVVHTTRHRQPAGGHRTGPVLLRTEPVYIPIPPPSTPVYMTVPSGKGYGFQERKSEGVDMASSQNVVYTRRPLSNFFRYPFFMSKRQQGFRSYPPTSGGYRQFKPGYRGTEETNQVLGRHSNGFNLGGGGYQGFADQDFDLQASGSEIVSTPQVTDSKLTYFTQSPFFSGHHQYLASATGDIPTYESITSGEVVPQVLGNLGEVNHFGLQGYAGHGVGATRFGRFMNMLRGFGVGRFSLASPYIQGYTDLGAVSTAPVGAVRALDYFSGYGNHVDFDLYGPEIYEVEHIPVKTTPEPKKTTTTAKEESPKTSTAAPVQMEGSLIPTTAPPVPTGKPLPTARITIPSYRNTIIFDNLRYLTTGGDEPEYPVGNYTDPPTHTQDSSGYDKPPIIVYQYRPSGSQQEDDVTSRNPETTKKPTSAPYVTTQSGKDTNFYRSRQVSFSSPEVEEPTSQVDKPEIETRSPNHRYENTVPLEASRRHSWTPLDTNRREGRIGARALRASYRVPHYRLATTH